jgi:hypothetical protein
MMSIDEKIEWAGYLVCLFAGVGAFVCCAVFGG